MLLKRMMKYWTIKIFYWEIICLIECKMIQLINFEIKQFGQFDYSNSLVV